MHSDNAQWQLGQLAERTEHGYGCGDEEDELGLLGAEEARVDVSQHGGAQSKVALHQAHGYASAFAWKKFYAHGYGTGDVAADTKLAEKIHHTQQHFIAGNQVFNRQEDVQKPYRISEYTLIIDQHLRGGI